MSSSSDYFMEVKVDVFDAKTSCSFLQKKVNENSESGYQRSESQVA